MGNGAGWGARMMLLSQEWRNKAIHLATKKIEYVELTTSPGFSRTFAHSLRLPGVRCA
ncbi:MAG: ASKHA domain-containing protein [Thermoleophilia bacterium]